MTWFFTALACAVFTACCDALCKRLMETNDEWFTGTVVLAISGILLIPVFLWMDPGPPPVQALYVLAVDLPLEILGYYLFLSALRMAPLSLTIPLLAFTPVFTILTSAVIVREAPTFCGGLGVLLVTLGAYLLNGDPAHRSILDPLRALWSNRGSRRMLAAALVWSVTLSVMKRGVLIYGAIPYGFMVLWGLIIAFALVNVLRIERGSAQYLIDSKRLAIFALAGVIMTGAELTHFVSLSLATVAYMVSVKRMSLIFGVILGRIFFQEHNLRYRLPGAAIMVCGVFLLFH